MYTVTETHRLFPSQVRMRNLFLILCSAKKKKKERSSERMFCFLQSSLFYCDKMKIGANVDSVLLHHLKQSFVHMQPLRDSNSF